MSPEGPWEPLLNIVEFGNNCNNPSPFLHPNGTLYLACTWDLRRAGAKHVPGAAAGLRPAAPCSPSSRGCSLTPSSRVWLPPFAERPEGPWTLVADLPAPRSAANHWEDPFLFIDKVSRPITDH